MGESFKISEFVDDQNEIDRALNDGVNLKKLGFKILHEINKNSYIPEISIVGTTLQAYQYFSGKDTLPFPN